MCLFEPKHQFLVKWKMRKNSFLSYRAYENNLASKFMNKSRLFQNKSGVRFSFCPFFNFAYIVPWINKLISQEGQMVRILVFISFYLLWGPVPSPHTLFSLHSTQSQFYFHLAMSSMFIFLFFSHILFNPSFLTERSAELLLIFFNNWMNPQKL